MSTISSLPDHERSPAGELIGLETSLAGALPVLDLPQRLASVRARIGGRIVFTTSFGLEDQAISHAIFTQNLLIDVVTLDTGRLFPETYELWAQTERRYGRRIHAVTPDHRAVEALIARDGVYGMRNSPEARHACCDTRKLAPLKLALTGAAAWITGVRAKQSENRAQASITARDPRYGLLKVNPLIDWTRAQVDAYVRDHHVPYNPLHDRGFLSIGCAPCTRAVRPGEPERAGRWWWEQDDHKECGLHLDPSIARASADSGPALAMAKD